MNFVYVPDGLGNYRKSDFDPSNMSFNMICEKLGYANRFYIWFTQDYKTNICFKLFSRDIICIVPDKDLGYQISGSSVKRILNDNDYSYESAFDTYSRESALEEGIEGRYLSEQFMAEAVHEKLIGNTLVDALNGYTYFFEDGVLVRYTSNDGLIGYAKQMKDTYVFKIVKANAEKYYSKRQDILDEINRQFEYYTRIPGNCLDMIGGAKYGYDFGLLYLETVHPDITIEEFNKITHNEAIKTRSNGLNTEMMFRGDYYCFDKNNILTTKEYKDSEPYTTPINYEIVNISGKEKVLNKVYALNDSVKSVCIEVPSDRNIINLFLNHCDCMIHPQNERIGFIISKEGNAVQASGAKDGIIYFTTYNETLADLVSNGDKYLGQVNDMKMTPDHTSHYIDILFVRIG